MQGSQIDKKVLISGLVLKDASKTFDVTLDGESSHGLETNPGGRKTMTVVLSMKVYPVCINCG